MTGPEHYRRAEELAELAAKGEAPAAQVHAMIALAQVHATLALASATAD